MSLLSEKLKKILAGEEAPHIELPPAEEPKLVMPSPPPGSISSFASTLPPAIKAEHESGKIDLSLGEDMEKVWKARYAGLDPNSFSGVDVPYGPAFKFPSGWPYPPVEAAASVDPLTLEKEKNEKLEHQMTLLQHNYDYAREWLDETRTEKDELLLLLKELNYAWVNGNTVCPFCGGLSTHESSCPMVETLGQFAQRKE